ncbi:unnamed protein product [Ceratitis capitata]|uniref:(Mediterranean fruit fly) hypothetical protein n=1 Tax=Ceratitis capitata TaxID=7213 RepID=A0A811VFH4_CERCA|nr:unnamed protein product [Ceratitis capitata]
MECPKTSAVTSSTDISAQRPVGEATIKSEEHGDITASAPAVTQKDSVFESDANKMVDNTILRPADDNKGECLQHTKNCREEDLNSKAIYKIALNHPETLGSKSILTREEEQEVAWTKEKMVESRPYCALFLHFFPLIRLLRGNGRSTNGLSSCYLSSEFDARLKPKVS